MKFFFSILACILLTATHAHAQGDISLKIGGSFYINCSKTITFDGTSIMTISGDAKNGRNVNFNIYSSKGELDVILNDGKFSGEKVSFYSMTKSPNGFFITDKRSNRIVLKVIGVENKKENRTDLHVWADFFLPNGGRFQCTPDESNIDQLNMIHGTFKNSLSAIELNN